MQLTKKTKLAYKNNSWVAIRGNKIRELDQSRAFKIVLLAKYHKGL